ncbi:PIN domain-containing protein [Kiritimatiellota bacterium B12222]|nr:PIN domain-containing protein [Kiritimatiellota bacterium B12222]
MKTEPVFLDTNILLYAASNAAADKNKKKIATEIIQQQPFRISAQVVQEFIANVLRKPKLGLGETHIDALLELSAAQETVATDVALIQGATNRRRRFKISHWDACILEAASRMGCTCVYTEDLNHGQIYGDVRVLNPFIK